MEALAVADIPPPEIGFELVDSAGDVIAEAELAWEAELGAVLLAEQEPQPVAEDGWRTFRADAPDLVETILAWWQEGPVMTGSRMAMSSDFLAAFAKLPSQQQRLVRAMIARFERDSRASGLNYEKFAGAKDPNMRSLRIDGGYRAVVLKPAEGNVHILLWADNHDDAYQWATRHACSINAETGALQVYQPQQVAEEAGEAAESPPTDTPCIFGQLKHRELLRLGVPAAMAAEVLEIQDEAALEEMAPRLPCRSVRGPLPLHGGRGLRADHP